MVGKRPLIVPLIFFWGIAFFAIALLMPGSIAKTWMSVPESSGEWRVLAARTDGSHGDGGQWKSQGGGAKLMAHLMDQPKPVGVQEWTGASGALLDQPGTDAWPSQWGRGWEEGPGAWPEKSADFRQGR